MSEIICPTCNGEKYFDRMTGLTINGDVWTQQDPCETCNGDGWIEDKQGDEWLVTLDKAIITLYDIYEPAATLYDERLGDLLLEIDGLLEDACDIIKSKQIKEK